MEREVIASLASLRDALTTISFENVSEDSLSCAVRNDKNNDTLSPDALITENELLKVENELLRSRLRVNLSRQNHSQSQSTNEHFTFPHQMSDVSDKGKSVLEKLQTNSQVVKGCMQELREFLQQMNTSRELLRHQSSTISSLEAKTLMFQEKYQSINLNRHELQLHCRNGPQNQLYNDEKQQELDKMRTSCLVMRDLLDRSQTALRDLQQICKLQSELLETFERRDMRNEDTRTEDNEPVVTGHESRTTSYHKAEAHVNKFGQERDDKRIHSESLLENALNELNKVSSKRRRSDMNQTMKS